MGEIPLTTDPAIAVIYEIVDEDITLSHDAAIARVYAYVEGRVIVATGSSRRAPSDKPDKRVAILLASARAHETMSRKLYRRAHGYIEHNDKIKAQRPIQLEKSKQWHEEHDAEIALTNKKMKKNSNKVKSAKKRNSGKSLQIPVVRVSKRSAKQIKTLASDCV